jgi:hypothetical protein
MRDDPRDPMKEGMTAAANGAEETDNPYGEDEESEDFALWAAGWAHYHESDEEGEFNPDKDGCPT